MRLYQRGEYAAFEELYRRHSPKVYGYLKKRALHVGEADDLLQVVFLKLHRYRSRYDASLPFLPWLFSIAQNALIDQTRRKKPTPMEHERLFAIADSQPRYEGFEGEICFEALLDVLPEGQRQMLRMRFEQGMSFDEIAEQTGIKAVSIRKRVSRTVQSLRGLLMGKELKGGNHGRG